MEKDNLRERNYVYLLRCADDSLYCGWTTDLEGRIAAHNNGTGAKYTKSRRHIQNRAGRLSLCILKSMRTDMRH